MIVRVNVVLNRLSIFFNLLGELYVRVLSVKVFVKIVDSVENGKIPFLDCLVTLDNNKLKTTIYRKPTHTDRLLDQSSYNPTSHKATTIRTLTRRAQLVCDSPDSLQDETDYLNNVFSKNNYNTDFVRRNTHSNTDSNTQTNSGPVTTATIPYIRGTC